MLSRPFYIWPKSVWAKIFNWQVLCYQFCWVGQISLEVKCEFSVTPGKSQLGVAKGKNSECIFPWKDSELAKGIILEITYDGCYVINGKVIISDFNNNN